MTGKTLPRRYWESLTDGPLSLKVRGRDGYSLWQRYWASLLGFRLPVIGIEGQQSTFGKPAVHRNSKLLSAGAIRLPRFDRAALRLASTSSAGRRSEETVLADWRYVQRDAGGDRLEIIVESSDPAASDSALSLTVVTPDRSRDYLAIFKADAAGVRVAGLMVPSVRRWAEVSIWGTQPTASIGENDFDVVVRSVRAAPDPWVPVWLGVARVREAGDPVRDAIEGSL
jgi:hypothetical protein